MDPFSILLPGLVGAVVVAAVLALTRKRTGWDGLRVALAVSLGFVATRLIVKRPGAFPPTYGENWLPLLALVAAAGAWSLTHARAGYWVRGTQTALLSVAGTYLLLASLADQSGIWTLTAAYAGGALVLSLALERLSQRGPRLLLLGGPAVAAGAAGAIFALNFSIDIGRTFAGLALIHAAAVALTWTRPARQIGPVLACVFGPLFGLTMVVGTQYGYEVPVAVPLLLGLCPLAAFVPELTPLRRRAPWLRIVIGTVLAIGLGAAAFALADSGAASDDPYASY